MSINELLQYATQLLSDDSLRTPDRLILLRSKFSIDLRTSKSLLLEAKGISMSENQKVLAEVIGNTDDYNR